MNHNFELFGEIKALTPKKEQEFFLKAFNKDLKVNALEVGKHREWVRSVIRIFADKAEISFAQAVQIVKSGTFEPYSRLMHLRAAERAPEFVGSGKNKKRNPFKLRQEDLSSMEPGSHHDFMKIAWMFAVSLNHPSTIHRYGGSADTANEAKLAQRIVNSKIKHPDETRQAHHDRTIAALKKFNEGDVLGAHLAYAGLETVGDLRTESERMVDNMRRSLV